MKKEANGKISYKIGLHIHTQKSDGCLSYEDVLRHYKDHGYDVVAVTDHWVWNPDSEFEGMKILSGAEYNIGGANAGGTGVFHILAIGCDSDPGCDPTDAPETLIDKIHAANGIAVLAHPAWSLNSHEDLIRLKDADMTEIYNTVSDAHESSRPYSGIIIDIAATKGRILPIHAADDSHYYDGSDDCIAAVYAYAEDTSKDAVIKALRSADFYSSTGPFVDVVKTENGKIEITTSPVSKIAVLSNFVWTRNRTLRGENLTHNTYTPVKDETFVRVEATDKDGRVAWSNIIKL